VVGLRIPVGTGPIESASRISIEEFLAQPAGAVRIPLPDGEFMSYTNGQLIRAWAEQIGVEDIVKIKSTALIRQNERAGVHPTGYLHPHT